MTDAPITTCQICGRAIKSKNGFIAHHGYKRPFRGSGFQTRSCSGARHLPYEVSCDVIPRVIADVKSYISNVERMIDQHMSAPPDVLHGERGTWEKREFTVEKPANFDPAEARYSYKPDSYEWLFDKLTRDQRAEVKAAKGFVEYLEERLAKWQPPAE